MVLEEVTQRNPLDAEAPDTAGDYYAKNGQPEKAQFRYETAGKISGFEADALVKQAQLLVSNRKYDGALELLRKAQKVRSRDNVQRYLERGTGCPQRHPTLLIRVPISRDCRLPIRSRAGAVLVHGHRWIPRVLLLLGLFALIPGFVQAQDTGSIGGAVVNGWDGRPLSGVIVTVRGTILAEPSDASGRYRLENVPAGNTLSASASPALLPPHRQQRPVAPGLPSNLDGSPEAGVFRT